jgi:hypothetical protein
MHRLPQVAAEPEKILWESVKDQKTLSLSRGRRPRHAICPLPDRFMQDGCSIVVRINLVDVIHRRYDPTASGVRGLAFIGDSPPEFTALAFDQVREKAFSCTLFPPEMHEDSNCMPSWATTRLRYCRSILMGIKHFVDMPSSPQPPWLLLELACIGRPKLLTPQENGFLEHRDPTFSSLSSRKLRQNRW